MNSIKRISIYAIGTTVCVIVLRYIDYPDPAMACLAVAVAVVTTDSLLRMCDRLLDPPPAILRFMFDSPKIISAMPPHDLTGFIEQSKD
ncbi:MAG: hypothetical protein ACYC64_18595 [Armatimonadota bacterium]